MTVSQWQVVALIMLKPESVTKPLPSLWLVWLLQSAETPSEVCARTLTFVKVTLKFQSAVCWPSSLQVIVSTDAGQESG